MSEVGGDDVRPGGPGPDLRGDLLQLGLGARGNHHVSTAYECDGDGGAQPAARAGHHRYLVVEPESVQNHVCLTRVVVVARMYK